MDSTAVSAESNYKKIQRELIALGSGLPDEQSIQHAESIRLNSARLDALRLKNSILQMVPGIHRYWKYFMSLRRPPPVSE